MMKKAIAAVIAALMILPFTGQVYAADEAALSFGDPNGDGNIDAKDASFILAAYSRLSTGEEGVLTAAESTAADVKTDGNVDAKDASAILAYYSYLSTGGTDSIECYLGYEETPVTTTTSDISTQTTTTKPIATTTTPSQDDPSNYNEFSILASMYAKGYVPVGTYSGSYIEDSEYGHCVVFYGNNRNGGSGTNYSRSYSFSNEDDAYDSYSKLARLERYMNELWDNGTVANIMKGANYGRYSTEEAYFIAAVMSGDCQFGGKFVLPF